jgi:benzoyl-CoA reductase/2-hydroxyglutaryl-CoA dehydratase subunit BcrC/BadD/HgdB
LLPNLKVMIETDSKSKKQSEFMRQHSLTEQDLRKLISEKFERARAYTKAVERKREALLEDR